MLDNGRSYEKIKTFTSKAHCETLYDKPEEQILNIIVQSSDNKILLINIAFNKGKCKIVPSCDVTS